MITNVFVARALQPSVASLFQGGRTNGRIVSQDDVKKADRQAFLQRNLFQAEREDITAKTDPTGAPPAPPPEPEPTTIDEGDCNPERCKSASVQTNLLATLWFGDVSISRAVFQSRSGGEVEVLQAGDPLSDDAIVTAVLRNNVCISRAGRCEIFTLQEDNKKTTSRKPAIAQIRRDDEDESESGSGIRKLNEKAYEIPKAEIDGVLSNLSKIARQARIVPSFQNGKSNGFKLFSIRPNSLYSKIGIKNGDIVQKINGFEMTSPDKALEIYQKLKDANSITVDLLRRGKPQTMSYTIR